jgi:hypothetical protein
VFHKLHCIAVWHDIAFVLSVQVIYAGKASRSLPPATKRTGTQFTGWLWSFTENHWSNLAESKSFVRHLLVPYFKQTVAELILPEQQKCIWLIDCLPVHIGAPFREFMQTEYPWILLLFVPPNCTSKLQPQDKVYQKPFKKGTLLGFCDYQVELFRRCRASSV